MNCKNQKLIEFSEKSKNNLHFGVFKETYPNGTLSYWTKMDVEKRNKFVKVSRLRIMVFDKNLKKLKLEIEGKNYLFFLYFYCLFNIVLLTTFSESGTPSKKRRI